MSKVTKKAKRAAEQERIDRLYELPESKRDAPTLLGYKPTYHSFLKKKAERRKKTQKKKAKKQQQTGSPTSGRANIPIRQVFEIIEEGLGTMGRDNPPPKVNLSKKRKSSDAPAVAPEKTAPVQKKHQKQPSSATVPSTEKHTRPASSPHSKQPAEKATHRQSALTEKSSSAVPFTPSFTTEDGRRLTVADSVQQDPPLVITLLQGLGLPRDMKQVPRGIEGNLDALFTSIAMVRDIFVPLVSISVTLYFHIFY